MNKLVELLNDANVAVEHSSASKWIKPITRKLKLGHFLQVMDVKTDKDIPKKCEEYRQFCEQHKEEFERLPGMLEDDFSRYTLEKVMEFRKSWDMNILKGVTVGSEYFPEDIISPVNDEVFIDGGAYIGDTVERFIKKFGGGVQENICLGA